MTNGTGRRHMPAARTTERRATGPARTAAERGTPASSPPCASATIPSRSRSS